MLLLLLGALLTPGAVPAQTNDGKLVMGYLELKGDKRYRRSRTLARYLTEALGRPYAGAEVALTEIRWHGAAAGVTFDLTRRRAADPAGLLAAVDGFQEQGIGLILLDLPAKPLAELAAATRGRDLLLFNVSAPDDMLRQEACQSHLLHTIPSRAMSTDALGQFLVFRKWRKVLVLEGPGDADKALSAAFQRTAQRYGLRVTDVRPWVLSNDPRQRDQNNVALLTGGDYDVVFVADSEGEFARDVPYQTQQPQLVVGSEGLAGLAWHWAWERHGAPELEKRFDKQAGRPMRDPDWAAWMAVKAVAEAVQRAGSAEFAKLRDYLLGPDVILDGFKGNRMNFRPWNRQLRQPMLLGTHNWVVERAPIRGFLHDKNNLDTLGFDRGESQCEFDRD